MNPPSRIKLNHFQRLMLQWNELQPYNAVHVVHVPVSLDLNRLKQVVSKTLEPLCLNDLVFNRSRNPSAFTRHPAREPLVSDISVLADPGVAALLAEVQRQLNLPFFCGPRVNPFRFFVQPDAGSFSFALTYFHPAADAESSVLLLRSCVEAYRSSREPLVALELYPNPPGPFLLRHCAPVLRKLAAIPGAAAAMRRSFLAPVRDHNDLTNRFVLFSLPPEKLRALLAAAKSWEVTLNDVFLAILLKCLSPLASRRALDRKRKNLSLGCIVNLRKDLGFESRPVFGLFLGSFIVTHEVPDSATLPALARDIGRQTLRIKRRRLALATPVELAFGRFVLSFFSTARRKKLYQKHYPLWGGITNMNLNSIWPQQDDPGPVNYFRAVSTGPATPLVLSTTTIRDRLNVGITFRSSVFSDADIQSIKSTFLACVDQIEPHQ